MEIPGYSTLRMNCLLVDNLVANPPAVQDYSPVNNLASSMLKSDISDYADISDEAYKLSIIDDIQVPQSPTSTYNNNFSNMIVNYLNKDLRF